MTLADTLVAQGKADAARHVYEQARELEPRNGTPLAGLARLAEAEGRRSEAADLYQRAVDAPAPGREAAWRLAALLIEDGDLVSADALLRRLDPEELRAKAVALRLANAEIRAHRRDAAVARLEAARLAAPGDPELARQVGLLRLEAGQLAEAQAALEDALAKTPDDASAKADLAYVLALRGQDLDRALALAQGAVDAARPGEAAGFLDTLAAVHLARGDAAAALAAADRGLASRDAPPIARAPLLARRAAACAALGRRADARSALREAFAADARAGNTAAGWKPMAETLARELGVTPPAPAQDTSRG
jgi:Flp pilus assembly protein TadD